MSKLTVEESKKYRYKGRSDEHMNFVLIYGCKPALGVDAETQMVCDIIHTLQQKFDRETLSCEIPDAFEYMKGKDVKFEMVTSNTIQPTKMIYKHNVVTEKIAYIFVNSKFTVGDEDTDLEWTDFEERGEMARELFQDILEFRTQTFTDLSKDEIIFHLRELE